MVFWKRAALALSAVSLCAAALVTGACGDDDGGDKGDGATTAAKTAGQSSSVTVDPAKADALAHQAMFTPQDLPGTGWAVTSTDTFDDSGPGDSTAACKAITTKQAEAKKKSAEGRAGRAKTELSRNSRTSPLPTSVEIEVNVFKDTATPQAALSAMREQLKGSDWESCLKDTMATAMPAGVTIETKPATPQANVPQNGEAKAYDFTFTIQGQSLIYHIEMYAWQYSNTGTTVTIGGARDEITAELAKATVTKADANVQALGK